MSPVQQQARVEVDLDRKEELILAKQLRACRVNILPRPAQLSPKVAVKIFMNLKKYSYHYPGSPDAGPHEVQPEPRLPLAQPQP